ncbi:hypothetical protein A3E15_01335 [Candidatus Woesebacteria bacterium RIFCSPHIGHO2_12_FULL_42_9]|uniref:Uncharacterized protein n=2 Tax=Candidatus Woeseibacteriota TaxID=1752722 RepID=A0A1F8AS86_9BACT|nr:MAG: hypothetical protein A2129_02440 [Candidatus Woesebacteria bacterium GWC1_42_13]OGM54612.1 MAG: hypothetical protein A3E15_01335 [Candidatus Woesebacteria bacterium RIFCSPHIGHO2_12_FULL_42_9]
MRQKGITPVIILVAVGALILLGSAGAYYYFKMSGKSLYETATTYVAPKPTGENPVSDYDDSGTLESELDETQVDASDSDFNELETSASSL